MIGDYSSQTRKSFSRDSARTMTVERGGITLELLVGVDVAGNLRLIETCKAPVLFSRSITARENDVREALQILATLKIKNPQGDWVDMYPSGFPSGWTSGFGDKRIKVPIPQDGDKTESTLGTASVQSWDVENSEWGIIDYFATFSGLPTQLAKVAEFYVDKFDGKSTIESSDMVEWEGRKLVRVRGTGRTDRDWIAWYMRTESGKLAAVYAVKPKGSAWPSSLPFDPDAKGIFLEDGAWPEANKSAVRTVTYGNGSISLYVYGRPQPDKDGVTFFADANESTQVMHGPAAEKLAADCDPEKNAQPPRFGAAGIIDAQKIKLPTGWWMVARQHVPSDDPKSPKVRRFEILYTVQDGTPFLIWLVGWDNDSFQNGMRETMLSAKGKDGSSLMSTYPYNGELASDYFGPFWGFKQNIVFSGRTRVSTLSKYGFVLPGWKMPQGTYVYFTHDWNDPDYVSYDSDFWPRLGMTQYSKTKRSDFEGTTQSGKVYGTQTDWDKENVRYTVVTVKVGKGSLIHFYRVWKSSDAEMRDFLKTLK